MIDDNDIYSDINSNETLAQRRGGGGEASIGDTQRVHCSYALNLNSLQFLPQTSKIAPALLPDVGKGIIERRLRPNPHSQYGYQVCAES